VHERPREAPPPPSSRPLERSPEAEARQQRSFGLHAWNVPLLGAGAVAAVLFFGRGRPLIGLSTAGAIALGCLLWALVLTPVLRYRSRLGGLACLGVTLLAIPLCLLSEAWLPEDALRGWLRVFPASAAMSAFAVGALARAGKL